MQDCTLTLKPIITKDAMGCSYPNCQQTPEFHIIATPDNQNSHYLRCCLAHLWLINQWRTWNKKGMRYWEAIQEQECQYKHEVQIPHLITEKDVDLILAQTEVLLNNCGCLYEETCADCAVTKEWWEINYQFKIKLSKLNQINKDLKLANAEKNE